MGYYKKVDTITNVLPDSITISNWSQRGGAESVTDNDTISPDGTQNASLVTGLGAAIVSDIWKISGTGAVGNNVRVEPSVYIKPISTSGQLRLADSMGVLGSSGVWYIEMDQLDSGWQRITRECQGVQLGDEFVSTSDGRTGIHFYTNEGPLSFWVWGAQVEEDTQSNPFVPTTTGAATADHRRDNHWVKNHNGVWVRTLRVDHPATNLIQYSAGPFHDSPGGLDFWDQFWTISAYENVASCIEGGAALRATSTLDGAPRLNYQTGTFSGNVEVISGIFERGDNNLNCLIGAWGNPTGTHYLNSGYTFGTGSHYATGYGNAVVVDYGKEELGTGPNGGEMIRMWVAYDTSVSGFVGESRYNQWRLDSQYSGYGDGILHHAQLVDGGTSPNQISWPVSPIVTQASSKAQGGEEFVVPFTTPPSEMTLYARWINGQHEPGTGQADIVATIGGNNNQSSLQIYTNSGNLSTVIFMNTSSRFSAPNDALSHGDEVECIVQLYSDGAIQGHSSINGGAVTSATKSASITLESAWNEDLIYLMNQNETIIGNSSTGSLSALKVCSGVQTLEFMRGYGE